ncbi:MAG: hypothetical protein DRG83_07565 [Deltaproteobacteria bacterium]|nr:MAG: hypothetical protein DRG83_07565 [Deltaproteobacteria bacterium]
MSATLTALENIIWPDPSRVPNWDLRGPAIPTVESVSVCMEKYGPNDWRTWRAQYFENRLELPDDPYRYENSNFQEARDRGLLANLWTGTPFPVYGMSGESSRLILYPLTGSFQQQVQSAALHRGESADIHSQYHSETIIVVWYGQGEVYLYDSWVPVTADDLVYVPVGCPMAWRVPESSPMDMVLFIVTAPVPFDEYIKTNLVVLDKSETAEKLQWNAVWKWADPGVTGLLGNPDYYRYPYQR